MSEMLRTFSVSKGVIASERTPADDELYVSPEKMQAMYGLCPDVGQLRFVQSLINAHCCRPSLWPWGYEERFDVPADRQQIRLSVSPVIELQAAAGRYSYGRRDRRALNQTNLDYVAALAVFGSPPRFQAIDTNLIEYFPGTGECWLPLGFFLVPFSTVQITYMAGYSELPDRVYAAIAEVLNSVQARGVSDRIRYQAGRVNQQYSSKSYITPQAEALLAPFVVKSYF